ncbi:DNA-binding response regulator [Candidatus Roizmanbacteria bacterium RIFCSPLOWO2_01_FULL_38_12]|uniref:DNA-binding response regulator n=1 Tax=Candidatus Roizmanbacteria bacterium RIFCSPLOWO2_01_FULL_38_12 TaxID=1802061 RepID=A0A1F7IY92_9BACT|nr:MAG: DNA-binding response regulator [Candidatus Roizmanbacteria bacterium RIFCSPHIGHO2_01_FULL_38_15]OGK34505.1 MAG: DNA-binding response regulator [Candidatus Roizmanbacteria bacterium RIFCSPHIGHO2_12_FULL_38_13]OGK48334.1 MAG: DNA-binding response regulator [Candidatus Roizmanbacteria bacterium RIFCSPLOWO2_01_FULL_38_12]
MRILIVEDEHRIAATIKKGLEQERYVADIAYSGTEGYDLAIVEEYDVILLDIMLPGMNGLELCRALREKKIHTPILMLTAKSQIQDKIIGLNGGADDYLTKPFSFEELLARIRALTRRPKKTLSNMLTVADLQLDPQRYDVVRKHRKISLTNKEFALLEYLMRNAESILTKDQIITHVWDYDSDILPNTVEVYIGNLRKKIDFAFKNKKPLIKTVRGFGYKISP